MKASSLDTVHLNTNSRPIVFTFELAHLMRFKIIWNSSPEQCLVFNQKLISNLIWFEIARQDLGYTPIHSLVVFKFFQLIDLDGR